MSASNKLNISAIKAAKPKTKPYRLSDGKGLFLLINPNGSKWWRFHYRYLGKQKTLSMGVFPEVSLANARQKIDDARKLLTDGVDPSSERKEQKNKMEEGNTFHNIALQWIDLKSNKWTEGHAASVRRSLDLNIFPFIGNNLINEINTQKIISVLKNVEKRGSLETLKKLRQRCSGIFLYANGAD